MQFKECCLLSGYQPLAGQLGLLRIKPLHEQLLIRSFLIRRHDPHPGLTHQNINELEASASTAQYYKRSGVGAPIHWGTHPSAIKEMLQVDRMITSCIQ